MDDELEALGAMYGSEFVLEAGASIATVELNCPCALNPQPCAQVALRFAMEPAPTRLLVLSFRGGTCTREALRAAEAAATTATAAARADGGSATAIVYAATEAAREALRCPHTSSQLATDAATQPLPAHSVLLLRVDHMRARAPYVAHVQAFAAAAGLAGRLLFLDAARLILIALVGPPSGCRDYLRLHRTTVVDVDAAGRRCKEKMLDVLHEGPAPEPPPSGGAPPLGGFRVVDCANPAEVVAEALSCGVPASVLADLLPPLRQAAAAVATGGGGASGSRGGSGAAAAAAGGRS